MVKRHFGEGGGDDYEIPKWEPKRRLASPNVLRDLMSGISLHQFVPRLEPFLRRVVQEEVTCAIQRFRPSSSRSSVNEIKSSGLSSSQLYFHSKLPSTLFTSSRVESEEGEPIKIVLVDANSKKIITSGPMSSAKIEIVVLDGDFVTGDGEDWTKRKFDACVIREREGKRPLLMGDLAIALDNGVADLGNICFTDNSSWIRSRKFRLGARVKAISPDIRVKEATSEPFIVKDHRGESYKKHHPPSLADEVWRLERIAKDGAFHKRLASARIFTVEDFLRLYVTDPSSLRRVLGGGISNRTWDTITEHATHCPLDDKLYLYSGAAERVVLVFNSIWKAIGAIFDGQNFQNLDKLTLLQMRLVEDVKRKAYKNLHELVLFNEESFGGPPMLLSSLQPELSNSPAVGLQNVSTPFADEDQLPMLLGSGYMTTSSPYTFEVDNGSLPEFSLAQEYYSVKELDNGSLPEFSLAQEYYSVKEFSPTPRNSLLGKDICYDSYMKGYSAAPSGSLESVLMTENLADDGIYQVEMSSTWKGNGYYISPSNQSAGIVSSDLGFCLSRNGKPKARWFKIRAALKWGISIRRDVAVKRMARLLYYDF